MTAFAIFTASMWPFITNHDAMPLDNHGVVSYGKTLLEAFTKMETIEHLAKVAFVAHQLGSAPRQRPHPAATGRESELPPNYLKRHRGTGVS